MHLRLVLSCIVLAALTTNPCFAKDGHAQHSARATAANNGASGKGASGANPAPTKAAVPIDGGVTIAPPVLPPHGVTQQQIRIINPSGKTPANPVSRAAPGSTTMPVARNAIGQPVVAPRNFVGSLPAVSSAPQRPGAGSPTIIRGASGALGVPVAAPVPSGSARVTVANATNRGSINGTTVSRPATAPAVIGGPAAARYGINGTALQNKH